MNQENWKLVLDYLSAKERGNVQEFADLEERLQNWLRKDPEHQHELDQAMWLWQSTAMAPHDESWKASFADIQTSLQTQRPTRKKYLQSGRYQQQRFWLQWPCLFYLIKASRGFYQLIKQPGSRKYQIMERLPISCFRIVPRFG